MTIYIIDYCLSETTASIINFHNSDDNIIVRLATESTEQRQSRNPNIRVSKTGTILERQIHRALAYIGDTHAMHSTRSTSEIINSIYLTKPDVVVINNVHRDYINLPYLAHNLIGSGIPTVLTLSTDYPAIFKLPALIKRKRYNATLFRTMSELWDNLTIVAPTQEIADKAASGIFDGHTIYIIKPTYSIDTAEQYASIFDNI